MKEYMSGNERMKPGFTFRKMRLELYNGGLNAWQTCVPVSAAQLFESRQIISLGDKYYFSVGAHYSHQCFLLSRNRQEPLTVEKSLAASSLLTFAINSPVVPDFTHYTRGKNGYYVDQAGSVKKSKRTKTSHQAPTNFRKFDRELSRTGLKSYDYFFALMVIAETLDVLTDIGKPGFGSERKIPSGRMGTDPLISWPSSDRTWRALTAYWSGILSLAIPGRILNFWRAVEAVTNKNERYRIFANLEDCQIKPVWTRSLIIQPPGSTDYWRTTNDSRVLKRRALRRRKELINLSGSTDRALDWLYMESRGKAAHADRSSLDFDGLSSFSDQVRDAILFQFMARVAIERTWS